ncbi:amidase [Aureimonas altamirensis]|uniref:amidase n=1 Tax=Aureimonas altamirensis TaxID=370622 RepID=UPI001E3B8D62|nr:amidase [Aureimonas altamirensis]UHD46430.1 amidase [Aureimonas altamirensis]
MNMPYKLAATDLVRLFLGHKLTPIEALDACLDRIAAIDERVKAFTHVDAAGARQAALAATERYSAGLPLGPLDGVPISIKDNLFVAGMPCTWGSALYRDFVPHTDDLVVRSIRQAGIVIVGKTNTPELAMAGYTDNYLFGPTGNPWHNDLSPGGSSGGAAASVGFGMVPLAIGTDAGGSIRRPASHCGLVGLKPGIGRVPRRYGFPALAGDLQVVSPIARTSRDLLVLFAAIATVPKQGRLGQESFRIGIIDADPSAAIEPEISKGFDVAVKLLRNLGHVTVSAPRLWNPNEVSMHFDTLVSAGVGRVLSPHEGWEAIVTPAIAQLGRAGLTSSASTYVESLDWTQSFRGRMLALMADFDLLALPTTAAVAWPKREPAPATINNATARPGDAAANTTFVNFAGLPAISVPLPVPDTSLPAGLQLIAPLHAEERLLTVAQAIELNAPWRLPGLDYNG